MFHLKPNKGNNHMVERSNYKRMQSDKHARCARMLAADAKR